jgi:hypothetical protein
MLAAEYAGHGLPVLASFESNLDIGSPRSILMLLWQADGTGNPHNSD